VHRDDSGRRTDVGTTALPRRGRRPDPGHDADRGQEPLERGGLGVADAGGPRTPRDGHHSVPQEVAGGQLHGTGHVASDAVGRQRAVGHGLGRMFGAQQPAVSLGSSQGYVPGGVRARRLLAHNQNEQVRRSYYYYHQITIILIYNI